MNITKPRLKLVPIRSLTQGQVFWVPEHGQRVAFTFYGNATFPQSLTGHYRTVWVQVDDIWRGNVQQIVVGPYVAVRIAKC